MIKKLRDAAGHSSASALGALVLALYAAAANATILTFDQTLSSAAGNPVIPSYGGSELPPAYGDRVDGAAQSVAGGLYTYGERGEGFTPNVLFEARTAVNDTSLWTTGYGDLNNVLFGGQRSMSLELSFTADSGYDVLLYGFDLGGWFNTDFLIQAVTVTSLGNVLFAANDVVVEGDLAGPRHTTFDFGGGLLGPALLLTIDYSNLAGTQQDNIGIDNARFGQTPPGTAGGPGNPGGDPSVPGNPVAVAEPNSLALMALAMGALLLRRGRMQSGRRRSFRS